MDKETEEFSRSLMANLKPVEQIHGLVDRIEQHKHFSEKFADYLKDLLDLHATFGKNLNRVVNKYAYLCNDDWNSPLSEFFSHLHLHFTTLAVNSENVATSLQEPLQKVKAATKIEKWNELKPSQKRASRSVEAYLKAQKKLSTNAKKAQSAKAMERASKLKNLWESDSKHFCEVATALEIAPYNAIFQFISSFILKNESTLSSVSSSLTALRQKLNSSSEADVISKLKTTLDSIVVKKNNSTFMRRLSIENFSPSHVPPNKGSSSVTTQSISRQTEASPTEGIHTMPNIIEGNESSDHPISPPDSNVSKGDAFTIEKHSEVEVSPSKFRIALKQTPISPALSPNSQAAPPPISASSSPSTISPVSKPVDDFDPFAESSSSPIQISPFSGQDILQSDSPPVSTQPAMISSYPYDPFTTPPVVYPDTHPSPSSSPQVSPQSLAIDPFASENPVSASPLPSSEVPSPFIQNSSPFSAPALSPFFASTPSQFVSFSSPSTLSPFTPSLSLPELIAQELFSAIVIEDRLVKMMAKGQIMAPLQPIPFTVENPRGWPLLSAPSPSVLLRYQHELEQTSIPSLDLFPLCLHVSLQCVSSVCQVTLNCSMLPGTRFERLTMTCGTNTVLMYEGQSLQEHVLTPSSFPFQFQCQVDPSATFLEFQVKWDLPFLISKIGLLHPSGISFPLKEKCVASLVVFRYPLPSSLNGDKILQKD